MPESLSWTDSAIREVVQKNYLNKSKEIRQLALMQQDPGRQQQLAGPNRL